MIKKLNLVGLLLSIWGAYSYAGVGDHVRELGNGQVEAFLVTEFPVVDGIKKLKGVIQAFDNREEAEAFVTGYFSSQEASTKAVDLQGIISESQREMPEIVAAIQDFLNKEEKEKGVKVLSFTHRLKELGSFKKKIFDRIRFSNDPTRGRRFGPIHYANTFGDIIGVRIVVRDDQTIKQIVTDFKASGGFEILDVRTLDGSTHFLNVKTKTPGAFGFEGAYEIQIWPWAASRWLDWQHGRVYKSAQKDAIASVTESAATESEEKDYFKKLYRHRDQVCHQSRVLASRAFLDRISVLPEGMKVEAARRLLSTEGIQILRETYPGTSAVDSKSLKEAGLEGQNGILFTGFGAETIRPEDQIDMVLEAYEMGLFSNTSASTKSDS